MVSSSTGRRSNERQPADEEKRESAFDLASWKEIADYLKVSVRTAQLWERKHGLPVRRLPGVRGKVIASRADLDAWRAGSLPAPGPADRRRWAFTSIAAALALLVGAWVFRPVPKPSSARALPAFLVVSDEAGQELWRKRFDLDLGQFTIPERPRIWVGDLDGDGESEVLFAPARLVQTATNSYPPPYFIAGAALLHDRDGDGSSEVYLAGTNNARRSAELVVLDPERFSGAGDEAATPEYHFTGLQKGVEIARFLLPGTCVQTAGGSQYNSAVEIQPGPGEVAVTVIESAVGPAAPAVYYRFDRSLRLIRMETSDPFLSAHRRLHNSRHLDHPWSEADRMLAESKVTRIR